MNVLNFTVAVSLFVTSQSFSVSFQADQIQPSLNHDVSQMVQEYTQTLKKDLQRQLTHDLNNRLKLDAANVHSENN